MTTIAWDGKTLAVDSQLSLGDALYEYSSKLFSFTTSAGKSGYAAVCGDQEVWLEFIQWFERDTPKDEKPKFESNFGAIVLLNGKAFEFGERLIKKELVKRAAMGSGWIWAMAAMDHGKNATEAVLYASEKDLFTGGPVNSTTLEVKNYETL